MVYGMVQRAMRYNRYQEMSAFKLSTSGMLQMLDQDIRASHEKEKAFLLQKIEFLNESISEYAKREDDNKKINSMLMELLNGKESIVSSDKEAQLLAYNSELQDEIVSNKRMHEQIVEHLEAQIKGLKEELKSKQVEKEKSEENYSGRVAELQGKLSQMIADNAQLQSKIHEMGQQITERKEGSRKQTLYSTLRENGQVTRRDFYKEQELKNTSPIQSRVNSISDVFKSSTDMDIENNINEGNGAREVDARKDRVRSYMKKGKGEIKMMMSTLLKTKGQLEEGYQNVTYLAERESLAGKTGVRGHKSFYQ